MARTKISEFSATPANNTDIDSINIAEGCAPSGINDAIRELMAQLKDFQTGAVGDSFNGPVGTSTAAAGAFTTLSASGTTTLSGLTASTALALDASKNVVSVTNTGTGNNVLATSPTLVTPALGTPSALVGTNITGTATSFNINGTVGATTPTTGAFTTLAASGNVTLSGGTANGVAYLNGSKVVTSGSALTFDGTNLSSGVVTASSWMYVTPSVATNNALYRANNTGGTVYLGLDNSAGGLSGAAYALTLYHSGNYPIVFSTNSAEQMRLTSTGLGIGTSSPASPLAVAGTASVNWAGAGSSTGTATIGTQGTGGSLLVQTPSVNASYASGFGVDGTYSDGKSVINLKALGTSSGGPYSADMAFFTSTNTTLSEKMRLDSSGNLGLGVTPSADWASSGYKAAVVRSAFLAGGSGVGVAVLGNNAYNDGGGWRYVATGVASYYVQNAGAHSWSYAASGTAGNAITFSQAMTLTANGELMVGTTTATGKASIAGAITATASSALVNPSVGVFGLYTGGAIPNTYVQMPSGGSIDFWKADTGVAARIDSSGNLLVGTTSQYGSAKVSVPYDAASNNAIAVRNTNASTYSAAAVLFQNSTGSNAGYIQISGSNSVIYATSSDYRLKENIAPMTGALAKVAALKPVTYTWKNNGELSQGFIAHELQAVVPECVVGEKDAVDSEGNPKYQGIDTSFLVATLTAALQEAVAEINQLKARLDAANL